MKALPRRPKPPLHSSLFASHPSIFQPHRAISSPSRTTRFDRDVELYTLRQDLRTRIRAERVARREDWFLGPLAPRRDAGKKGKDLGVVTTAEFLGLGDERRKSVGEKFAKPLSEGKWIGRGKKKMRVKIRERLGEGKEALGRGGRKWVGWEECLVEVGDRVVVVGSGGVEDRDRGMIGEVTEVRKVEGEVVVEGLNLVSTSFQFAFDI